MNYTFHVRFVQTEKCHIRYEDTQMVGNRELCIESHQMIVRVKLFVLNLGLNVPILFQRCIELQYLEQINV